MNRNQNVIDRAVSWSIRRYAHAIGEWTKANVSSEDRGLIANFLTGRPTESKWNDDERRRIALATSWIYADIRLLGQEFSGADLKIKRIDGDEHIEEKNHPALAILRHPNDVSDMTFIWQYTIAWMNLRGNGYLFLAPETGNPNKIVEIWPVPADRITPLPDKSKLIRGYAYKMPTGEFKFIDPRYIVHFMFPNPFSLIDGLAPLSAAATALDTEVGISTYQRDMYVTGRGVPHTVLALPQDTGERDFLAISAQIREEFEQERKIIVTRSGDINVAKVGLTNREMDLVSQRNFTRDELDIIFLGFAIHGSDVKRETEAIDKMIKEKTVYPLHRLIAGQLTLQYVQAYFDKSLFAEFDDIRAQDRAMKVQEMNVYSRGYSLNEFRAQLNMPVFDDGELPGIGDLPITLGTDPQFIMAKYGLGVSNLRPNLAGIIEPQRKDPTPTAALPTSDAPKNTVDRLAAGKTAAELQGIDTELARYKKVATKAVKGGQRAGLVKFESNIIPNIKRLKGNLLVSDNSLNSITTVFESFKADLRGGGRGRRNKQTIAVNDYQNELGTAFEDWSDETASELSKTKPEDREKKIDEQLVLLLLLLIRLGRKSIPDALDMAVGDGGKSPEMVDKLSELLKKNEAYLTDSLIPDIKMKLLKAFDDPDIQLAIAAGDGVAVLGAVLSTITSRVESYAGTWWSMRQWGTGMLADENNKAYRWNLDNSVINHCVDCLQYGDQTYESFAKCLEITGGKAAGINVACTANCRCTGEAVLA